MTTLGSDLRPVEYFIDNLLSKGPVFKTQGKLQDHEAFILWFLHNRYGLDPLQKASEVLTGDPHERKVDAVHVNRNARSVCIIQSKLRKTEVAERREDVVGFASVGNAFSSKAYLDAFLTGANRKVATKVKEAFKLAKSERFSISLCYLTTGKVKDADWGAASNRLPRKAAGQRLRIRYEVWDRSALRGLLEEASRGFTPHVPPLELSVMKGEIYSRKDKATGLTSYVFATKGQDLAQLFHMAGPALFNRNIRGALDTKNVNHAIRKTLDQDPEYFWYYNNGVTIACQDANTVGEGDSKRLEMVNPQVINGQQTTRALAAQDRPKSVEVLVRVVVMPARQHQRRKAEDVLVEIVKAANSQNPISQADLMANDDKQVKLELESRDNFDLLYLRKREAAKMTKDRTRYNFRDVVFKEEMARALCAAYHDPQMVLGRGAPALFEPDVYRKLFTASRTTADALSCYFLNAAVKGDRVIKTKRKAEWVYARWQVLHYLRAKLEAGGPLAGKREQTKFVRLWLMRDKAGDAKALFSILESAIVMAFEGCGALHETNKEGKPAERDPPHFFRLSDLHLTVESYLSKEFASASDLRLRIEGFATMFGKASPAGGDDG